MKDASPFRKNDSVNKSASTSQVEFALARNTHRICFSDLVSAVRFVFKPDHSSAQSRQAGRSVYQMLISIRYLIIAKTDSCREKRESHSRFGKHKTFHIKAVLLHLQYVCVIRSTSHHGCHADRGPRDDGFRTPSVCS